MCAPFPTKSVELALCFQHPATYLPLEAVGARGVANFQEAGGGGPAGRVLPRRRLFRLDP